MGNTREHHDESVFAPTSGAYAGLRCRRHSFLERVLCESLHRLVTKFH